MGPVFLASGSLTGMAKHLGKTGRNRQFGGWQGAVLAVIARCSSNRAVRSRTALSPEHLLLLQCLTWLFTKHSSAPSVGTAFPVCCHTYCCNVRSVGGNMQAVYKRSKSFCTQACFRPAPELLFRWIFVGRQGCRTLPSMCHCVIDTELRSTSMTANVQLMLFYPSGCKCQRGRSSWSPHVHGFTQVWGGRDPYPIWACEYAIGFPVCYSEEFFFFPMSCKL